MPKWPGFDARYLIDNNSKTSKTFWLCIDGYRYSEEHTVDPTKPVFVR